MLKTSLYLFFVTGGAFGISVTYPTMLDYYYSVMVAVGCIYGARTSSFAYSGLMVLMAAIYMIENNSQAWHINIHILSAVYFVMAFMILIFRTDDGLKVSEIITGLIAIKWLTTMLVTRDSYLLHQILNFLSVAQWVVFARFAAQRIKLNKAYTKRDNPFMLKLAVSWNQFKTRYATTKSV